MKFELPKLPYAIGDLEPHLTARTLELHYDRHHRGYLEKLRGLIEGTPHEKSELSELVISTSGEIFNNAAQVWNHTFYWHSMAPDGGGQPSGRIDQAIVRSFGSFEAFQKEFIASAVGLFGSGYVWLTFDHAYYLDYQNARQRYVEAFLSHLANWRFANENLATCTPKGGS